MRPLDFAPFPGGPARTLFADGRRRRRAASGWPTASSPTAAGAVDFASYSPAATLEWRGHRTVQALLVLLRANGVI